MREYIVSVDFGKKRDPATIMVFRDNMRIMDASEDGARPNRAIHYLETVAIEEHMTTYTELGRLVAATMDHVDLKNNTDLICDGTGVGEAAIDILREMGLEPLPIIFTGGSASRQVYDEPLRAFSNTTGMLKPSKVLREVNVPKDDLVTAGRNLMEQGRIKILRNLRLANKFQDQLKKFRGKLDTRSGHTKHEAEDERDHDDMVICYLMAAWWLSYQKPVLEETIIPQEGSETAADWDPYDFA